MKKISLLFFILYISNQALAQVQNNNQSDELLSKRGYRILPQQNDWSIGFDAVPLIDFALNAVNIMNNTGQTAENPGYLEGFDQVIVGKYFESDEIAYRVRLGVGLEAENSSIFFDDPLDTTGEPEELENVIKDRSTDLLLSGGIERRRGKGRLQGIYGAELTLNYSSAKTINEYGLTWNQEAEDAGLVAEGQTRLIRNENGAIFGLGGRGVIGVEYFFAPKMAISAEYGLGLVFSTQGRGEQVFEVYENGSTSEDVQTGTSSGRAVEMSVDNANASLNLYLYF